MIIIKKVGKQSYFLENPVSIISTASIVGPKEKDGPLHQYFDLCLEDEFWGEKSWEKAESKIIKETTSMVISKSNLSSNDIDLCLAGDLLNQCIASSFGIRDSNIPFIGLFGACSTFVESLIVGSSFIDGNFFTENFPMTVREDYEEKYQEYFCDGYTCLSEDAPTYVYKITEDELNHIGKSHGLISGYALLDEMEFYYASDCPQEYLYTLHRRFLLLCLLYFYLSR